MNKIDPKRVAASELCAAFFFSTDKGYSLPALTWWSRVQFRYNIMTGGKSIFAP